MGSQPPPGCWVPKQGPSPRPGRRMAQEAFEAYGKSSPLPALPPPTFLPGYVPPPVSMGTGGSRHGTLSTLRGCGDYRQGAAAAGDPGLRSLYLGEGREGQKEETPPPTAAKCLASCLRRALHRACTMRATEERQQAPPPPPTHTSTPGVGGRRKKKEGGGMRAPADKAAGWGGSRERVRDRPHDRARRELAPCTPPTGGPPGVRTQGRKGDEGGHTANPPPPLQRDKSHVPAPQRHHKSQRTDSKGAPSTPEPATHPKKGRGQRGDSEGTWGGGRGTDHNAGGRDGRQVVETPEPGPKKKERAKQRTRAGKESRDGRGTAGTRERGKGRGKGGSPGDESGEAGTNTAANGEGGGVTRACKGRW